MKRRRKIRGAFLVTVPLRGGWRRSRQPPRSGTVTKKGRGSRRADLTARVGSENKERETFNKSQRVTPLLAQRIRSRVTVTSGARREIVFKSSPQPLDVLKAGISRGDFQARTGRLGRGAPGSPGPPFGRYSPICAAHKRKWRIFPRRRPHLAACYKPIRYNHVNYSNFC
jgi:hypothetical protein